MSSLHRQVMAGLCGPKVGVGVGHVLSVARIKLCSAFANMGMFSIDEYVQVFQHKITQNNLDGLLTPEILKIPTWNPPMSAMSTKTILRPLLEISGIPSGIHSNSPGNRPGTGLIKSVALMECPGSGVWLGKFLGLNTSGSPNGQRIWAQIQIRFVRF